MALKQRLLQKQVQKMIMSMKMQQSMQILQLPIVEINQLIAEELATNPVLEDVSVSTSEEAAGADAVNQEVPPVNETSAPDNSLNNMPRIRDEKDIKLEAGWLDNDNVWFSDFFDKSKVVESIEKHNFMETLITKSSTLQEDLLRQYRLSNINSDDIEIAEQIIGNIAENGYLAASIEEIAHSTGFSEELVGRVLEKVQSLDPAGVAARDFKECLLLQLKRRGKENSPEAIIIKNFLNELAAKKYNLISKELKVSLAQVKKYVLNISSLDPKPFRNYAAGALRIVPDVILEKTPSGYEIIINAKNLPQLSISQIYKKIHKDKNCPEQAMRFIKEKLQNAQNLISGLSQRNQTLERVTKCIISYQGEFIEKGIFNLKPLTLKQVAEKLEVHPSTISRTVANKYIQTPYGTFALKNFFSQAIVSESGTLSNQNIKAMLEELIKTEQGDNPYSDQEIEKILKSKDMNISRRTVTKYRNSLKIPPAHLRRK
ncbi:MAG: RNA polymerase factor sigma-54 [Candidatus Omnitrophica bacterium]|nr:RNA polymerase factor sigma-54 [Candidatus Omnitrophota bacterium]